ncbi:hypothetical protein N9A28_04725 [Sulfurimonas sp.]|nr:hypothetical protein [Sulfurimonas sp.]
MKKLYIILLFPYLLLAQSFLISTIELPKTYVQNLNPQECDDDCMEDYIDDHKIFSFLANASYRLEDSKLEEIRKKYISIFNLNSKIKNGKVKIALLLPYKKIGRYAASTTNASFAYLMTRNQPFELKSYKLETETFEDISKTIKQIQDDGFDYIIAPLTQAGEEVITNLDPEIDIYFPTINKKDSKSNSKHLHFGGIDYRAQSDILINESISPLIVFYDKSTIGQSLSKYQEEIFLEKEPEDMNSSVIKFLIPKRTTNLEKQLKENSDINMGTFFINTPIIKSGMIMSQLTLYDTNSTNILSTQTNYNPLLLSMTQYKDRKNMIIANSITQHKDVIIETNSLLGNDIVYDWINYTTTVGVDYFLYLLNGQKREYDIEIEDNQMIYPIKLIQPSVSRFIPYHLVSEDEI